jgi:RNA polymerase sigma-70 factor (ECF subfamily)
MLPTDHKWDGSQAVQRPQDRSSPDGDKDGVLDERSLVLHARQSPEAFEPLYTRHFTAINTYCFNKLGDQAEADDATSSIFAKAYFALDSFDHQRGVFPAWLFRIARNEVIDRQRHRSRHKLWPLDWLWHWVSPEPSPEEVAIESDARTRVRSLLATLPKREREVLELDTDELDTDQIAAVLGVTAQNVRSIRSRAYGRLRARIAQTGPSGSEAPGD